MTQEEQPEQLSEEPELSEEADLKRKLKQCFQKRYHLSKKNTRR